jgi:ribosomal protein S18 acetylase RimI-like enzyme
VTADPGSAPHRLAEVADAGAIARLHVASWRDAYRPVLPASFLEALDVSARARAWAERLARGHEIVLLADSPGGLAGFCACGPSRDEEGSAAWEIRNLHVSPPLRSRGTGARLFRDAAARGFASGHALLTLWVVEENTAARRFYARQGMSADGARRTRELAPGTALNEVRYRAPLPIAPA